MIYFYKKRSLLFLLATLYTLATFGQCPDGATITANTKCIFLSWITPPNPLPASITYNSVTYNFQNLGTGASNDPAVYRDTAPGGGACNANQSAVLTGQIFIPGPCNYVDGNLPLNLLSFEGQNISNINYLKWQTSFEDNSGFFEIERSQEGIKFENIGTVQALNNNSKEINNYSFTDPNFSLDPVYYRLKIVDLDGSFERSRIIAITGNDASDWVKSYPNPTSKTTNLRVENESLIGQIVQLFAMNGKEVKKFSLTQKDMILDLENVPKGEYLLKFADGKFLKIAKN